MATLSPLYKKLRTTDIIESLAKGETLQTLGKKYKISRERVRQLFEKETASKLSDLKAERRERLLTKKCWYCGNNFVAKDVREKFCSLECRHQYHQYRYFTLDICSQCHLGFLNPTNRSHHHRKYCSKTCQGAWLAENHGWGSDKAKSEQVERKINRLKSAFSQLGHSFTVNELATKAHLSPYYAYYKCKNGVLWGLLKPVRFKKYFVYIKQYE